MPRDSPLRAVRCSKTVTSAPPSASSPASISPVGPAPITMTSVSMCLSCLRMRTGWAGRGLGRYRPADRGRGGGGNRPDDLQARLGEQLGVLRQRAFLGAQEQQQPQIDDVAEVPLVVPAGHVLDHEYLAVGWD